MYTLVTLALFAAPPALADAPPDDDTSAEDQEVEEDNSYGGGHLDPDAGVCSDEVVQGGRIVYTDEPCYNPDTGLTTVLIYYTPGEYYWVENYSPTAFEEPCLEVFVATGETLVECM